MFLVSLAQLVEHLTLNQAAVGSNPTRDTIYQILPLFLVFLIFFGSPTLRVFQIFSKKFQILKTLDYTGNLRETTIY